jgi:translocation protein SEC63
MCDNKRRRLAAQRKRALLQPKVIRKYVLLFIGWSIVAYMSYRSATTKVENKIWDPYIVLGIPSSSSLNQIKSHYKKLSRALHPDKIKLIGNMTKEMVEQKFVDITKAYKAYYSPASSNCRLTDDEIRRNYEEYGHPDGKQEFSIGIALPKWIVESSNGYYVLGLYGLLFGVLLPAFVGRWWYRSRNLTKEGIETETAAKYLRAVKEHSNELDVIDMLASSHEFQVVQLQWFY